MEDDENVILMRINPNTLLPEKQWAFRMKNVHPNYNLTYNPYVMTFADENTFYMAFRYTSDQDFKYFVWEGTLDGNQVTTKPAFRVHNMVGDVMQGLQYNRFTQRLFIQSDAWFGSFSTQNTGVNTITDAWNVEMNTRRESEGITFDGAKTYLMLIRGPEIMEASVK